LPVCFALHTAPKATAPETNTTLNLSRSFFRIGDQLMTLERYEGGYERPYVLVSLHSNEMAAIHTAMAFASTTGATFYRLQNRDKRHVEADLLDRKVRFDPGKVFTANGRKIMLKKNDCWDKDINDRVQEFAHFLTGQVVTRKTVVAVHNNDDHRKVHDYAPGGTLEKSAKELYINPSMDPDDFLLTTDEEIYGDIKARGFNVVLQNNARVDDDGSLAVYCARAKRKFVKIETKSEHVAMQEEMLVALDRVLR
jgi:hypothetical protein